MPEEMKITKYIRSRKRRGYSDDAIIKELISNGWDKGDAVQIVRQNVDAKISIATPVPHKQIKKRLPMDIGVLIALLLLSIIIVAGIIFMYRGYNLIQNSLLNVNI